MGMSMHVTIGPYVEVIGKLTKTEIKVKRVCPNHPNQKNDNAKFCPSCGTEIQNVDYTETKVLSPLEVLWNEERFEDSIYSPEGMEEIFLPNKSVPKKIKIDSDYGGSVDLTSSDEIKDNQLKWMQETYSEEINFLIENFGKDKVFVKWGVVSYWS
jgi:hypothetical protein